MRERWKQVMAVVLAAGMTLSLAACGGGSSSGGGSDKGSESTAKDQNSKDLVYRASELDVGKDVDVSMLGGLQEAGGRLVSLETGFEEDNSRLVYKLVSISEDGDGSESAAIDVGDGADFMASVQDGEGGLYAVLEKFADDSAEGSTDEDASVMAITEVDLVHYGADGEVDWSRALSKKPSAGYYASAIAAGKDTLAIADSNGLTTYSAKDGKKQKKLLSASEADSKMPVYLQDGTLVVSYTDDKSGNVCVDALSADGKVKSTTDVGEHSTNMMIYPGKNYDFYVTDSENVYGYKLGDKDGTKILNFIASDLSVDGVTSLCEAGDGKFGVLATDDMGNSMLYLMDKVDSSDVKERTKLTLGCYYIDPAVKKQVVAFNQQSGKYKITIEDYSRYDTDENTNAGMEKLGTDIASGNAPDLLSLTSDMPVQNYIAKGVLADLTDYVEKDSEMQKMSYLENVMEATKVDGKYYYLMPSFSVMACTGKTADIGADNSLTIEKTEQLAKERGIKYENLCGPTDRDSLFTTALTMSGSKYIDWEKKTCSFDSDSFISLLKFVKKFPEKVDKDITNGTVDTSDYWRDGKALLNVGTIAGFDDYRYMREATFGTEVAMTGFPNENPSGADIVPSSLLAMSSTGENPDAAWKFIRGFMLKDYQESLTGSYSWPVSTDALETMGEQAQQRATDDTGATYDETYMIGGTEITSSPLTQEQVNNVLAFLKSLDTLYSYDSDVVSIITEEAGAYFSGQKSAEDVAKVIQSRVKIYINEKS